MRFCFWAAFLQVIFRCQLQWKRSPEQDVWDPGGRGCGTRGQGVRRSGGLYVLLWLFAQGGGPYFQQATSLKTALKVRISVVQTISRFHTNLTHYLQNSWILITLSMASAYYFMHHTNYNFSRVLNEKTYGSNVNWRMISSIKYSTCQNWFLSLWLLLNNVQTEINK